MTQIQIFVYYRISLKLTTNYIADNDGKLAAVCLLTTVCITGTKDSGKEFWELTFSHDGKRL